MDLIIQARGAKITIEVDGKLGGQYQQMIRK